MEGMRVESEEEDGGWGEWEDEGVGVREGVFEGNINVNNVLSHTYHLCLQSPGHC